MTDMIGDVLGNYRITRQIGSGGMGLVYEAEHVLLGKRAAVKVLKPDRCESPEIVERFFNEARAAAHVKDPGIPEIFDYGRLPQGNAYLTMEMLEGETLGSLLAGRARLGPGRAISLCRLIAGTLKATHEHGIVHRDLKPDNVFIVPDPAMPRGERIMILDFGIAKLGGSILPTGLHTETGRLMGTPYYMSPEQCRGKADVDHRTDVYALGCVLYQMLCGRPPFSMRGSGDVLAAHIHLAPKPIDIANPSVPPELASLTMRLLEKDPQRRPQTMQRVIDALNDISGVERGHTEPSLAASGMLPPVSHLLESEDTVDDDMLPLQTPTTMEASSGEFDGADPFASWIQKPRGGLVRRAVMPVAAAMGLLFGAWGAYTVVGAEPDAKIPPQGQLSSPPSTVSTSAQPIIVRELVEAPAEFVELRLRSEPPGARVYRVADGVEVGRTPLSVKVRQGQGSMHFVLRKTGYRNADLELGVQENADEVVILEPRSAARNSASTQATPLTKAAQSNLDDATSSTRKKSVSTASTSNTSGGAAAKTPKDAASSVESKLPEKKKADSSIFSP